MVLRQNVSWSNWNLGKSVSVAERKTKGPGEKPSGKGREPPANSTNVWRRIRSRQRWLEASALTKCCAVDRVHRPAPLFDPAFLGVCMVLWELYAVNSLTEKMKQGWMYDQLHLSAVERHHKPARTKPVKYCIFNKIQDKLNIAIYSWSWIYITLTL